MIVTNCCDISDGANKIITTCCCT